MQRLHYERGTSRRFWEGRVDGATLIVRFGRIDTQGQERKKKLASAAAAKAALAALVEEKMRKGYVVAKAGKRAAKAKAKLSTARRKALAALASELGGRTLVREVTLAMDDPEGYLREFRKRMAAIGVDEPQPDLAWLAITEGLTARKAAVELDWKEEVDSVLRGVRSLAGAAGKKALAPLKELDRPTEEALELIGKALAETDLALVQLDKRSDSYVVTVRRPAEVPSLTALARKAGGRLRWFRGSPKALAALEKERRREEAKWARQEAKASSDNPWTRLLASLHDQSTSDVLWKLRHRPYPVEEIRAALPHAPKRDQPLIAMVLAVHDRPASEVARETDDPTLCLRALKYLGQEHRFAAERLAATAVVAERLGVPPKGGRLTRQVGEACNLFGDPAHADRAWRKLPPAARDRLARIGDQLIARGMDDWDAMQTGIRALLTVGDESSIASIATVRANIPRRYAQNAKMLDEVVTRIRARIAPR